MAFSSAISIEKYATIRFGERASFAMSLETPRARTRARHTGKSLYSNTPLSKNPATQASDLPEELLMKSGVSRQLTRSNLLHFHPSL
jgi:hypothetical protein